MHGSDYGDLPYFIMEVLLWNQHDSVLVKLPGRDLLQKKNGGSLVLVWVNSRVISLETAFPTGKLLITSFRLMMSVHNGEISVEQGQRAPASCFASDLSAVNQAADVDFHASEIKSSAE